MLTTLLWVCSPSVTATTYRPVATISPLLLVLSQLMDYLPALKTVSPAIELTSWPLTLYTLILTFAGWSRTKEILVRVLQLLPWGEKIRGWKESGSIFAESRDCIWSVSATVYSPKDKIAVLVVYSSILGVPRTAPISTM